MYIVYVCVCMHRSVTKYFPHNKQNEKEGQIPNEQHSSGKQRECCICVCVWQNWVVVGRTAQWVYMELLKHGCSACVKNGGRCNVRVATVYFTFIYCTKIQWFLGSVYVHTVVLRKYLYFLLNMYAI